MSDLDGNPKDRFTHYAAQMLLFLISEKNRAELEQIPKVGFKVLLLSGAVCLKLTMSLVSVLLKFKM